jgi:arginine/ornithine N-succinyltransferase beta subunit
VELRGVPQVQGEACLIANMESAKFCATLSSGEFVDNALLVPPKTIEMLGLHNNSRACAIRVKST